MLQRPLEAGVGLCFKVVITELAQEVVWKDSASIAAESVVRDNNCDRIEGGDLLKQATDVAVKDAVALAHPFHALSFVVLITARTLDVSPQFVLNPVRLLEV